MFAGISPEDTEALREARTGPDFLSLTDLEAITLLMRLNRDRVASNAAYHRAKGMKKVMRVVETLAARLEGMSKEERVAFLATIRGEPATIGGGE